MGHTIRAEDDGMRIEKLAPIRTTLRDSDHPYLTGAWTPQYEEVTAHDLPVLEGSVPADLDGVYLRNTENQIHQPLGRYHPFDGDAMIHQLDFRRGQASYRNRFVRTRCLVAEQEAGGSLWGGLMDPPGTSLRPGFGAHGSLKDSSSTDIITHNGVALSTFYQCGEAYCLDPQTLETLGVASWAPLDGVSAHCKVDPHTGELMFFNYSKHAPYMHYGVVDRQGRLVSYQPIPLPGPRLPHDMAVSARHSILNDLPAFWDTDLLDSDVHAVRMHDLPSRFGVIPAARPLGRPALVRSRADVCPALPQCLRSGARDRDGRLLPGKSDAAAAPRRSVRLQPHDGVSGRTRVSSHACIAGASICAPAARARSRSTIASSSSA
jgi:carotenoid cleavage dioxygenase